MYYTFVSFALNVLRTAKRSDISVKYANENDTSKKLKF